MSKISQAENSKTLGRYKYHDSSSRDLMALEMLGEGEQGLFIHREPASKQLLIVFTGMAREAGGIPLMDFYKLVTDNFKINVIYMRDHDRLGFLDGIKEMGGSYESTIEGLRELKTLMGIDRLMIIGLSTGGFTAVLYGLELGAERVAGYGAPTAFTEAFVANDQRSRNVAARLRKQFPDRPHDLRPLLENHPNPPKVDLHYGELMLHDRRHAEHLSGLPSVEFHPLANYAGHPVMTELYLKKRLEGVLEEFLA